MRVLLIDSVPLSFGGGYERFLVRLGDHLRHSGHGCTIVTPRRATITRTRVALPGRAPDGSRASSAVLTGWRGLREAMATSDVLYLKNEPHELLGVFALRSRPPVVVGLHSATTKVSGHADLGSWAYASRGYGRLLRRAEHIHALQQSQADWCVSQHHIDSSRISVVPNGIDLEYFRPAPPRLGQRLLRMLFVGRLDEQKGVDVLLSAVRLLVQRGAWRDTSLTIAGTGPLLDEVSQLARDIPHVEARGYVHGVAELLQEHDLLIVPSRWEAMALVPLEGLASGLPLIVSDIAPFDHLRGPAVQRTGVGEPSALAAAMTDAVTAYGRDPVSLAQRAVDARSGAEAQFGSATSLNALTDLLRRCAHLGR